MTAAKSAAAGYTLLEVLITLVIVGLISGLLFEGLGGAARQSLALADKAGRLERVALASDWWRASMASILPATEDEPNAVNGAATTLTAFVAQPLHARPGAPRTITWTIVKNGPLATLSYVSDDLNWDLARTQKTNPHFSYLGEDGAWKPTWNEPTSPRLIALLDFFDTPIIANPRSKVAPIQPPPMRAGGGSLENTN